MADETRTLGFGLTYDMVAARTACGQLLTLTSHPGDHTIPPHRHANDYVCIVLVGGFAELEGNAWRDRRGGYFFTHHAGETHHDCFGPRGAICVNLHSPAGQDAPAAEGLCPAAAGVAAHQLAFELVASSREELLMASLAAEIMGELLPDANSGRDADRWLDTVAEAISDQPQRRWTLNELAAIAQRHPVHVAQSFRANTGVSLGSFQRIRRLTCLSLKLRHGTVPLATLAAEFGYCDQPHMSTEFRAAFGVSPGRYRRAFH